jgi:hypothetical protein
LAANSAMKMLSEQPLLRLVESAKVAILGISTTQSSVFAGKCVASTFLRIWLV